MFFYSGGHKYIFPGAEVYYDPDDEFEDEDNSHSSGLEDADDLEDEEREESQESFHSNHTNASSSHHPRLDDDLHSTETPHLSPEDVDSLLSTADNGETTEHVEDWTNLNASLDTSLDCDHTLTGFETDSAQHGEEAGASRLAETIASRCSPPPDLWPSLRREITLKLS